MKNMKKLFFIFILITSSSVFANTTYLSCSVSGSLQTNNQRETLKPSQISVKITQHSQKSLVIIIDGDDDYIASASTTPAIPSSKVVNLTDENKFHLMESSDLSHRTIKFTSTNISINRVTGLINVSKQFSHKNGADYNYSYSGMCNKVTGKKF